MPTSTLDQLNDRTNLLVHNITAVYASNLGLIEFVSVVISAILFAAIVAVAIQTGWWSVRVERFRHIILKTDLSKDAAQKSWKRIEEHFFKGNENDLKVDRLKNLKTSQLPNLDEVWQAHRLRNQIVHEPTFKLKRDLAERALKIYEGALNRFDLLS
jgi:hypothetical protein